MRTDDHGYFAYEVLDGSVAQAAGVQKNDRLLMLDGNPFGGNFGHESKTNSILIFEHMGVVKSAQIILSASNWSQAFQDATLSSIRIMNYANKRVGYVHLWSGVHPDSAAALWTAVKKFQEAKVDGVILDLRGGYGGAFWDHLDPFFKDRKDYFVFNVTDKDGQVADTRAGVQTNADAYLGPMTVLIDAGSRSGKEALAFQFKKSKRALLVGAATAGYFSGGGLFLIDQPTDYMLYLCVNQAKLDGVQIEGVGVTPDFDVEFDSNNDLHDSQLKTALEKLF